MTDGDNGGAGGDAGANNGSSATNDLGKVIEGLNKRIDEMASLVDKRFEGVAAKVREIAPAKKESAQDTTPVTHADLSAAYELGVVTASLPEQAREYISTMDRPMAERLAAARLIKQFAAPANGDQSTPAKAIPPGNAATAAPRNSPPRPKTQAEWVSLIRQAKADPSAKIRFDNLVADDTFDPDLLPAR